MLEGPLVDSPIDQKPKRTSNKVVFTNSNNCPDGLGFSKDNLESENI